MARNPHGTLNLIELVLLAASVEITSKVQKNNSFGCSRTEIAAMKVVVAGMHILGFRYHPGILVDPIYNWYYEAISGAAHVTEKNV